MDRLDLVVYFDNKILSFGQGYSIETRGSLLAYLCHWFGGAK